MSSKLHFRAYAPRAGIVSLLPLIIPFTIPFPIKANSWALTAVAIFFLFWAVSHKTTKPDFFKNPLFLAMSGLFLILVLGLSYTSDVRQGLAELEKNLCLLVFPFVVFQWKKIGIRTSRLLWAFTAGCVLITMYGLSKIFMTLEAEERSSIFFLGHSYYSSYIDLHPTYLSIYFIVITLFLVDSIVKRKVSGVTHWLVVIGLIIYSILFILFLRSRIAIPLLFIAASAYFCFLYSKQWKQWLVIFALSGSTAFIIFADKIELAIHKYGRNSQIALASRLNIWESAFEGYKLSPILGAGTGAAQVLIDQGYLEVGHDEGLDNIYNAHNQYLQFLCGNGVFGLGVYLVLLYLLTRAAIVQKNALFFIFITVFSFAMISESIIYVQKGIVSFYFFATCFYYLKNDD